MAALSLNPIISHVKHFFHIEEGPPRDRSVKKAASRVLLGPVAQGATTLTGDLIGTGRGAYSVSNKLLGKENPVGLTALGVMPIFGIITGGLGVKDGVVETYRAYRARDIWGIVFGHIKAARGGLRVLAGSVALPQRALTISALFTAAKGVRTASLILGKVGSGFSLVTSLLSAVSNGLLLTRIAPFLHGINTHLNNTDLDEEERYVAALKDLQGQLELREEEREEIRRSIEDNPRHSALDWDRLIAEKEERLIGKKERKIIRASSSKCLALIKSGTPENAREVITAVRRRTIEKIITTCIAITLGLIGIGLTIAGLIVSGGWAGIAIASLGALLSLAWLILDGYALYKAFKEGDVGRFDHLWIYLSTIVCLGAVTAAGFLSGGIVPIIIAVALGLGWLAINTACLVNLRQKTQDAEMPT